MHTEKDPAVEHTAGPEECGLFVAGEVGDAVKGTRADQMLLRCHPMLAGMTLPTRDMPTHTGFVYGDALRR